MVCRRRSAERPAWGRSEGAGLVSERGLPHAPRLPPATSVGLPGPSCTPWPHALLPLPLRLVPGSGLRPRTSEGKICTEDSAPAQGWAPAPSAPTFPPRPGANLGQGHPLRVFTQHPLLHETSAPASSDAALLADGGAQAPGMRGRAATPGASAGPGAAQVWGAHSLSSAPRAPRTSSGAAKTLCP